jgi:hypothetical protein
MAETRPEWDPMLPESFALKQKDITRVLQDLHRTVHDLDRLEPAECLNQYATSIQSTRRNLLLVASDEHFPTIKQNNFLNGSHVYWTGPFDSSDVAVVQNSAVAYSWMCSGLKIEGDCSNKIDKIRADPNAWRVGMLCANDSSPTSYKDCQDSTFPVEYCLSQPAEPHCRLQFDTTISIIVTVLNLSKSYLNHLPRTRCENRSRGDLLACIHRD